MKTSFFKKSTAILAIILLTVALVAACIAATQSSLAGDDIAFAAILKQGSTGSDVRTLQQKLKNWGYYSGSVDGIFGSGTKSAVQYFQRTNALTADGIVGSATAAALGMNIGSSSSTTSSSSGVLKQGSSGEAVKTLQQKLKNWGYYSGSVDGIFGSGTEAAPLPLSE